jgi:hypothetical protein
MEISERWGILLAIFWGFLLAGHSRLVCPTDESTLAWETGAQGVVY